MTQALRRLSPRSSGWLAEAGAGALTVARKRQQARATGGAGAVASADEAAASPSPLDDTDALAEAIEAAGASADIEPGLVDLKAAMAGGKARKGKKR